MNGQVGSIKCIAHIHTHTYLFEFGYKLKETIYIKIDAKSINEYKFILLSLIKMMAIFM